jgi:histidine ammonia-lyase
MVVRANQLGAGGAGTGPALLDALGDALNDSVTPLTRELGSLGTGELPGSAEIASLGFRQLQRDNRRPGRAAEHRCPCSTSAKNLWMV